MSAIFDPKLQAEARRKALDELEQELLTFARTAPLPVDRSAQAELAEEVRQIRAKWAAGGLLATEGRSGDAAMAA